MAISSDNRDAQSGDISRSIVGARAGSQAALGKLLQHYRDYLLRVAREELSGKLTPKVAQSDLVQETFLQAAQDFAGFNGESEWELRGWLRQILLNNLRDAERRFRDTAKRSIDREVSLQEHSDLARDLKRSDPSPSAGLMADENRLAVHAALNRLPADYRRAIELRSLEGRPFEEVGQILERTPAAARKTWLRAILKLAEELARHDK
ncbi:MAG: sigma-70 family RNA polymerase sigma factor [Pirellulales bacterium]